MRRDAYSGSGSPSVFSEKAGIYRSRDAGKTWTRLSNGLPRVGIGRVGLATFRKNPRILYAIVETRATGATPRTGAYLGVQGEDHEEGVALTQVFEGSPADAAGLREGDVIVEFAGQKIEGMQDLVREIRSRKPGDRIRVEVLRGGERRGFDLTLGGREGRADVPERDRGGVFRSEDGGDTWVQMSTLNPRPFYFSQIRIDPEDDRRIYVLGVQLHASRDGGKTWRNDAARRIHVDHHAMWINPSNPDHILLGNDGGLAVTYDRCANWEHVDNLPIGQFYSVGLDSSRPYRIYGGLQDNGSWGGPSRTRRGVIENSDWQIVMGMDGFTCRVDPEEPHIVYAEGQYGALSRIDLRTGTRRSIRPRIPGARFEWHAPLELSPHDRRTVYTAAQMVLRSGNRGDSWERISPDLVKTERGSVSVLGPSPLDANILWAGTNDGAVWVTRDGGANWTEVGLPVPDGFWVTEVEPSRTDASGAYIALEGRRRGDDRAYAFVVSQFGRKVAAVSHGLPQEPVFALRQDPVNPDVLYAGTERGVYVSIDGGARWVRLGAGLPVVPVYDLQVHARDGELVAATHGRSIWILDVRPVQQLSAEVLASKAHLFDPGEAVLWNREFAREGFGPGNRAFRGDNGPSGTVITYYLREQAKEISLEVHNAEGRRVAGLRASREPGLHRVPWGLSQGRRSRVPAGEYTVRLVVDGESFERRLRVVPDPAGPVPARAAEEY